MPEKGERTLITSITLTIISDSREGVDGQLLEEYGTKRQFFYNYKSFFKHEPPKEKYNVRYDIDPNGPYFIRKEHVSTINPWCVLVRRKDSDNAHSGGFVNCLLPISWVGQTVSRTMLPRRKPNK